MALSVCPSVRLSVRLSVCPSVCLSVHLSVHLSVRLSFNLSFMFVYVFPFPLLRMIDDMDPLSTFFLFKLFILSSSLYIVMFYILLNHFII